MAVFFLRRSLAHDEVDRYIHFAVVLFLFLALISILMPLSPTLSSQQPNADRSRGDKPAQTSGPPEVKTTCWCPAQFENSQVDYTNTVCTHMANGILNGINPSGAFVPVSDSSFPVPPPSERRENVSIPSPFESILKTFFKIRDEQNVQQAKNEQIREKARELIDFRTPTIFVVLALVLLIPDMLSSLLRSSMTSGFNMDQALENCVSNRSLDIGSQRQIHEETASAVADSLKTSKSSASSLFLFTKLLIVVLVLAETCFVGKSILSDIHDMEIGYEEENQVPGSDDKFNQMENASRMLFAYPNNVYHCQFYIRQLSNVHDYIVQCLVNYVDDFNGDMGESTSGRVSMPTSSPIMDALLLYQALFTITLAVLAFLLITSVINIVSWLLRLFVKSYVTSVGLPSNASRDVVLLVHLARLNAGPLVARGLAGSSVWSNRFEETDKEPAMESKA